MKIPFMRKIFIALSFCITIFSIERGIWPVAIINGIICALHIWLIREDYLNRCRCDQCGGELTHLMVGPFPFRGCWNHYQTEYRGIWFYPAMFMIYVMRINAFPVYSYTGIYLIALNKVLFHSKEID